MSQLLTVVFPDDTHTHRFVAQAGRKIRFVAASRIVNFRVFARAATITFVNIDDAASLNQEDVDRAMRAGARQAQLVQVWNHDLCDFTWEELLAAISSTPWSYVPQWRNAIRERMDGRAWSVRVRLEEATAALAGLCEFDLGEIEDIDVVLYIVRACDQMAAAASALRQAAEREVNRLALRAGPVIALLGSEHDVAPLSGQPGAGRFEMRSLTSGVAFSGLRDRAVIVVAVGPQSQMSAGTVEQTLIAGAAGGSSSI